MHTWHDLLAIAATLYLCIYRVKILRSHIQVAQGQHLVNLQGATVCSPS